MQLIQSTSSYPNTCIIMNPSNLLKNGLLCLLLMAFSLVTLQADNYPEKLITAATAGVTIVEFPSNQQLYARNVSTNKANVNVSGTVASFSGYDLIRVNVYKNNVLDDSFQSNLTYIGGNASFNFNIPINAELSNHTFELIGVNNGVETIEAYSQNVVAGDVYAINGQSNAEAAAAAHPTDQVEFLRSYTYNYGWNYINFSFPGLWGAHLGNKIIMEKGIPVAIFNQAVGAQQIEFYLRNDANPTAGNYGTQRKRLDDAGIGSNVRAFIWFQGEADGWNVSTEDYKIQMEELYDDWNSDYDLNAVYLYQMRYKSCNSPRPDILEAHRQSANELPNLHIVSTTNTLHDGCHFPYENGYKDLAVRLYDLVNRDVYGTNASNIVSPDVNSITVSNNEITINIDHTNSLSISGNPWNDFELEGGVVEVVGGSVSGNEIVLNLSGEAAGVTGVSYLGHPGSANDWIFNPKDVGILTFYDFPISNPIPGDDNSNPIDCSNINISTGNGTIIVSGLDGAPITHLQVFNANWSVAFDCLNNCNPTETVNIPEGDYIIYVKYYDENWTPVCQINENISVSSGGPTVIDNDNDGIPADEDCDDNNANVPTTPGTSCNDGNSNTTNDVIQGDGCSCEGSTISTGIDCNNINVSSTGTTITIAGLGTAPVSKLQIFTSNWALVHNCFGNCEDTEIVNLSEGEYRVVASLHNGSWQEMCGIAEVLNLEEGGSNGGGPTITDNDNDGIPAEDDCDDNNPAIPTSPGSACDDNNSTTTGDVIQADGCTCLGTDGNGGGNSTGADLELSMTAAEAEFVIYEFINYTLTLQNTGTETATNISVQNYLPAGTAYSSHVSTNGGYYFPWSGEWGVGNLGAGETAILELKLFVLSNNQPINNFAQVSEATGEDPDSTPNNNNTTSPSEDDEANVELEAANRSIEAVGFQLSQNRFLKLVDLFPNPAVENLNLHLVANESARLKLQLFNALGSLTKVYDLTLSEGFNPIQLDIADLPAGAYFILFEADNRHEPVRFIKQRL